MTDHQHWTAKAEEAQAAYQVTYDALWACIARMLYGDVDLTTDQKLDVDRETEAASDAWEDQGNGSEFTLRDKAGTVRPLTDELRKLLSEHHEAAELVLDCRDSAMAADPKAHLNDGMDPDEDED